jgi:hypothetical protein
MSAGTYPLAMGHLREQFPIFDELWNRIEYHIQMCDRQIKRFSKRALFVRYTLPLLTAFASGFAGALAGIQGVAGRDSGIPVDHRWISYVVAIASFAATIISAANSAMRPALQYGHYVRYINKFWKAHFELETDAEQILLESNGNHDKLSRRMHDIVMRHSDALDKLIEMFSEESVSNIGVPTVEKPT